MHYKITDIIYVKSNVEKIKETYYSLKERGYKEVNTLANLDNVPTEYIYSEQEGRLFICTLSGTTEVISATVKRKGFKIF